MRMPFDLIAEQSQLQLLKVVKMQNVRGGILDIVGWVVVCFQTGHSWKLHFLKTCLWSIDPILVCNESVLSCDNLHPSEYKT